MNQYIRCDKLNSVFKIEPWDKQDICGFKSEELPSTFEFELFCISIERIENNSPTLYQEVTMLKEILPTLIEEIKGENECVIQLDGNLCEGELPEYFPYILTCEGRRYYSPEISYNYKEGFLDSWVSFDFAKEILQKMPLSSSMNLKAFVIDPNFNDVFNVYHKQYWWKNIELLKHCLIYFHSDNDFDNFYIASKIPMEKIVKKWEKALKNFQVKRDKDDKEVLYYLIEDYLNENVDTQKFARVFTRKYVIETDYDELSEIERTNFSALNRRTIRFSPEEEDVKTGYYYSESQVREAAEKAWENLKRGK
ncbi:MAG: hypothetical protein ACM3SY_11415 [Candidatus Omnitrophota bacterium]